jgi:HSP20 family protein
MGLLTPRKRPETPVPVVHERDPFRFMRDMFGWDPFVEVMPAWRTEAIFAPAFEVKETKDAYLFKADLPGVKEADLDISFTGNRLIIGGKRLAEIEDTRDTIYVYERHFGSFTRTFTLPDGCDLEHVRAELKEGVLNLVVPKLPEVQPRKIPLMADKPKV